MLSLLDILVSREQSYERLQSAEKQRVVNVYPRETRPALRTRLYAWFGQVTKRQTRDVRTIAPRHRMA